MLSLDTIKAIDAHIKARGKAERLAEIKRKQRDYQIRLLVYAGNGWEDLLNPKHGLDISRDEARAAVLWGKRARAPVVWRAK
jgi:hypothetical protein